MEIDRGQTVALALGVIALVAAGIGAGYWLRSPGMSAPASSAAPTVAMQAPVQTPVYYQDPDGKADYSPTPKKTADGRDFKPVYADAESTPNASAQPAAKGKILYYRNPMGLADTSPVPKKDSHRSARSWSWSGS